MEWREEAGDARSYIVHVGEGLGTRLGCTHNEQLQRAFPSGCCLKEVHGDLAVRRGGRYT